MHGAGNDFVLIDLRSETFRPGPETARALADRHRGVGCDQILLLHEPENPAHLLRYEIWNADGTPAGQCGNGARCVALYVARNGEYPGHPYALESPAGTVTVRHCEDGEFELDMGYELPDVARFRASIFYQRGTVAAVLRLVPLVIPHYSEIGLPESLLKNMMQIPNGLILVTGPTGAGKSTTVASFLEFLNTENEMPRHIVTIEDPIEFYLNSNVCVIDQREVGVDTKNYVIGLRSALRQMPHIIFVGEMTDQESATWTLTAAETGHLVFSGIHTRDAPGTVTRLLDMYPPHRTEEIAAQLSHSLRYVISQKLLQLDEGPGRIVAMEILNNTYAVSNLIRQMKLDQLFTILQTHVRDEPGSFVLLLPLQSAFLRWSTLGLFLLFPFSLVFLSLITHIRFSCLKTACTRMSRKSRAPKTKPRAL